MRGTVFILRQITLGFFVVCVEMVFNTNVSTELTLALDCKNNLIHLISFMTHLPALMRYLNLLTPSFDTKQNTERLGNLPMR